jgi:CBS domain-containing protein
MGDHSVSERSDEEQARAFMRALLADVRALELMIEQGMLDDGPRRVGAEQEMFLVDANGMPAPVAVQLLDTVADDRITNELATFNLEANADPMRLTGRALSTLEADLLGLVALADGHAQAQKAQVLLTGILPSLRRAHLTLENMTPSPRYRALNDTLLSMRGEGFNIAIKGVDELNTRHDNVMFEACNTSFQIHFQVAPEEFAKLYNVAQLVTAPVLAAAVNSPVLFGARLWQETRVALFSSSIDERSRAKQAARRLRPRVTFGDQWVEESVLEIFREQIARFRVVLSTPDLEDPMETLERGEVPSLRALRLHNGTVYRWNRACYGVTDGKPHLRIENRVLPAGPTVLDEVANAALFFGLMSGFLESIGDPKGQIAFDHVKDNFFAAARQGLKAQFTWLDGETVAAADLIRERLLPLAREGLAHVGIDEADADRYLGVIEARVTERRTGASWILDSLASMGKDVPEDMRERALIATMLDYQQRGVPVHEWTLCHVGELGEREDAWRRGLQRAGQFMTTDLFTVGPDDLVDLAASVMEWEHIKHVPVEDDEGRLVGLITHRDLLRLVARGRHRDDSATVVRDLMVKDPVTVSPDTSTLDAIHRMREHNVGCLPVVDDGKLVGIITQADLIRVSSFLLEKFIRGER